LLLGGAFAFGAAVRSLVTRLAAGLRDDDAGFFFAGRDTRLLLVECARG